MSRPRFQYFGFIAAVFLSFACGTGCTTPGNTTVAKPRLNSQPYQAEETAAAPELESPAPLEERAEAPNLDLALEPGAELPVTRDGALLTALLNNHSLEVARFGPRISAYYVPAERAQFDPNLLFTVSHGKQRYQLAGTDEYTFGTDTGPGGFRLFPQVVGPNPRATISNILGIASDQLAQPPLWERTAPSRREMTSRVTGLLSEVLTPDTPTIMDGDDTQGLATLSTLFPTGTTVFLTGGIERSESNFVPTEYEGAWTLGVNQALLRGAGTQVNLAQLRQARNIADRSTHQFNQFLLEFVNTVEQAYWDVALAREVLSIREFSVALAEEQVRLNEDLLAVGAAVKAAVLSAQAEKASREAELHQAQGDLTNRTIRLMRLFNAPEDTGWEVTLTPLDTPETISLPLDREESEHLAMRYRPELPQIELDIENRGLDVVTARNQLLPQVDLYARYGLSSLGGSLGGGTRHLSRSRYYNYTVGLELDMPLGNRAERARHRQAILVETQVERILTDTAQRIRSEVREALTNVRSQWAQIEAAELAERSRVEELRIEQDRYEVGLVTNLDVLQVQRLLIEAQVAAATARAEYIKAITTLYAAEGTLLERRGIRMENRIP